MGLMDKMKNFIAPADDEYEDDEVTEEIEYRPSETKPLSKYEETNNAKVRNTVNADTKMVLFEPRTLEEAEETLNWFQRLIKKIKEFFAKIFSIFK